MDTSVRELLYTYVGIAIAIILILAAFFWKPLRKTLGLLLVICGILACLTGVGIIVGLPMIFVGGIMLFV